MPGDILESLRASRPRPIVAEREDRLLSNPAPKVEVPQEADAQGSKVESTPKAVAFKQQDPPTEKRKTLTLRVAWETALDLKSRCVREGISPETFLESIYEQCLADSALMDAAISGAKERYTKRQVVGVRKRAEKILEKYAE